jgi:flavin-binding protein dodecin
MAKNKQKGSRVYKRIELVGVSTKSFEDAIESAVSKANETLKGLSWFEVKETRGSILNGRVNQYQIVLVLNFEVL